MPAAPVAGLPPADRGDLHGVVPAAVPALGQVRAAARQLARCRLIGAAAPLEHDVPSAVLDVPPGERKILCLGVTLASPGQTRLGPGIRTWRKPHPMIIGESPAAALPGCASGARICAYQPLLQMMRGVITRRVRTAGYKALIAILRRQAQSAGNGITIQRPFRPYVGTNFRHVRDAFKDVIRSAGHPPDTGMELRPRVDPPGPGAARDVAECPCQLTLNPLNSTSPSEPAACEVTNIPASCVLAWSGTLTDPTVCQVLPSVE